MNSEEELSKNLTIALSKVVMYICIAIVFGTWIYSCNLNPDTIEECRAACQDSGSKMESVTSVKCICYTENNITQSGDWVLPRK
tara:strand:- start:643 stop:894 length:252 start_codon:yes stop_codon:yes gene_type:complete